MVAKCPSDNTEQINQSTFWDSGSKHWDAHRIGWSVAGGCALLAVLITAVNVARHARNYTKPAHQKQIIRILYMPAVYAIISFLSYRYFRDYTYYQLIEIVYESITISAFLLLLIAFVGDAREGQGELLGNKDKQKLMFPLCFWRYRPTKPYFMYAIKWSVMQYVVVRPVISILGIIAQATGYLCDSQSFNRHYASVYLNSIDFVSVSIALYGLILFYGLTKEELKGKRPLAKFLSIKLIVFLTFYQSFVFSALEGRVIHGTQFWTETNVADGLNALTTCIEMVFFSLFMFWAFPSKEYKRPDGTPATSSWKALRDSVDYRDFIMETTTSFLYFVNIWKAKLSGKKANHDWAYGRHTFASAFKLDGYHLSSAPSHTPPRETPGYREV